MTQSKWTSQSRGFRTAAQGQDNLMLHIIKAAETNATLGEIALRDVFWRIKKCFI
ncbi:MAG: hypothetical protein H7A33_05605 [Deltaproteobacteria bacterium]|nr:hypothetical protein [Deltaproteobacteria bacterium]